MDESYLRRQRHVLLDMHIPDWDPGLLSRFDPDEFVRLCVRSGADAVMLYCNSHVGLCYWPTQSGRMHDSLHGRDLMGQQLTALHAAGMSVCAYFSGPLFNNWAYVEHPDWRIVQPRARDVAAYPARFASDGGRFGLCCPNNPGLMRFNLAQVDELAGGYPFDAFFFDMVFWPGVCVCPSCRDRYRREESADLPEAVDWFSSEWCRFQAARERWLADAFRQLRDRVKEHRDIPVFLNGVAMDFDWTAGASPELTSLNDLLGGDFRNHSMLSALATSTPSVMQYMKAISQYTGGASNLMGADEQAFHAQAATAFGGQFMAIDAVAPDGTVNPAAFDAMRDAFERVAPYEHFVGSRPVADIAVYWSQQSAVDFADNGKSLTEIGSDWTESPHLRAAHGAFGALSDAHLPVCLVSRSQLADLDRYAVVVLPNLLRMDDVEVAAFRRFVERGGCLYASAGTSLTTVDGTRHPDFLLADLFGCHATEASSRALAYLKAVSPPAVAGIAPLRYAEHGQSSVHSLDFGAPVVLTPVTADSDTEIEASLTAPYADGLGTRDDEDWSSIHSSPPWRDSGQPAVTRHRAGDGEVVYSGADIEACHSPAGTALFVALVRSLMHRPATFEADAHPSLWITAFDDPTARHLRICLTSRQAVFPALPVPDVRLRLPAGSGRTFTGLRRTASGEPVPHTLSADGTLTATLPPLPAIEMLTASYELDPDTDHGGSTHP